MERTGRLSVWFGSKGYGFIVSENPFEKFFLHISKVKFGEPAIDAPVTFSILPEKEGRFRSAVDATISTGSLDATDTVAGEAVKS